MIILIWSHNTGIADDRIVIIWSHKSKFFPCSFVCLTTLSWQIVWQWWSGCTIFCSSLASTFVTDNLIVMIWPHQTHLVTCPCFCLIVFEKITIVVIRSRQLKWVSCSNVWHTILFLQIQESDDFWSHQTQLVTCSYLCPKYYCETTIIVIIWSHAPNVLTQHDGVVMAIWSHQSQLVYYF